jgi:hypothetical protein
MFLAYWFYVAFDFSNGVIVSRIRPDVFAAPVVMENLQPYSPFAFLFNNVDMLIFLFFAIVGDKLSILETKTCLCLGLWAFCSPDNCPLYVPTPIQTLWQTMKLFCFDRFMLLISPFMAFVMGWGLYAVSGYLQKRIPGRAAGSIVLLLFVAYIVAELLGIIMVEETPESRVSFASEELDGFDYIYSHVPYGSTVYSDYYTSRYFSQGYFSESDALRAPLLSKGNYPECCRYPSHQGFVIIPYSPVLGVRGLAFSKGSELDPGEGGTYPICRPMRQYLCSPIIWLGKIRYTLASLLSYTTRSLLSSGTSPHAYQRDE